MTGEPRSGGQGSHPTPRRDLILIGLRASGKTTVGRAVAARLHRPFLDLDDALSTRAGTPNAGEALRSLGEPAFRLLESELLRELLEPARREPERPALLALGGGTPTATGAGAMLERARSAGLVRIVLLDASIEALADRLARDTADRPPLTKLDPRTELETIASRRLEHYRRLADRTVDTTSLTTAGATDALVDAWMAS